MPHRTWKSPARSSLPPGRPEAKCPATDTADRLSVPNGSDLSRDVLVSVHADVLIAAVELIAGHEDREAAAFRRGRLVGFADGWASGLVAGLDQAAA